jgi:ABC-2 type transport system ATP-binding protein
MISAIKFEHMAVKRNHIRILSDITLEIKVGQVVGLLGPSGAGKTTLMQTIVGLLLPSEGQVTVMGQPAGSPALRPRIGYVTQSPSVYQDLTVSENLRYFGSMVGADRARASEVQREVRLRDIVRRPTYPSLVGRGATRQTGTAGSRRTHCWA